MIRKFKSSDREKLLDLINRIDIFAVAEKQVAVELLDEVIKDPENDYYNIFVVEFEGEVVGYHCTGKRALTDGVFDMYWIAVDPSIQNKGFGKELLKHAETFVLENHGKLILAETSSNDSYSQTRKFYKRNNYSILAEIKDFYKKEDHLIIFGKYLKT
ncbi:MAG: GNAT family N-acetyltransferase [Bacteroidetes bacterium]|nr:GNAT family N-acetyltransferase [Bacteroidota bacterium]